LRGLIIESSEYTALRSAARQRVKPILNYWGIKRLADLRL
jgi:hypothetical protein